MPRSYNIFIPSKQAITYLQSNKARTLNESDSNCQNQQIKTFSTFEEMNEADAQEMAGISSVQHLQNATLLVKKFFSEELKKPMDKRIRYKRGIFY